MAQIFQRRFVLLLKLGALGALLSFAVAVLAWRVSVTPHPAVGSPTEQPVPFSHKHHVGDVGLDCRYCHTSVEKSAFAGIPPKPKSCPHPSAPSTPPDMFRSRKSRKKC